MNREEIFASDHESLKQHIIAMEEKAGPFIAGTGVKFNDGRKVELQRYTGSVLLCFGTGTEVQTQWVSNEALYMVLSMYTQLFSDDESNAQYLRCCELTRTVPQSPQGGCLFCSAAVYDSCFECAASFCAEHFGQSHDCEKVKRESE